MPFPPNSSITKPLLKSTTAPSDALVLDSLIRRVHADGFVGDTMRSVNETFYTTSQQLGYPVVVEPAAAQNNNATNWAPVGWGHWGMPRAGSQHLHWSHVPTVDAWKWVDARRMTHIEERTSEDHTGALQFAFFNGVGFNSWENVSGQVS